MTTTDTLPLRDDPDFESLRNDAEFRRLTADASPTPGGPR